MDQSPALPAPDRRLARDPDGAVIAGVCSGLARRYAVDPVFVRLGVAILAVASSGLALLVYGLLWAILPTRAIAAPDRDSGGPPPEGVHVAASRFSTVRSRGSWVVGAGAGLMALALLFIFRELDVWWSDTLVWPLVLATAGTALVWRQVAGSGERDRSRRSSPRWYRGGFGLALLLGGALLFLYFNGALKAGGDTALAGLTAVIVIGLVLAPLWVRLAGRLSAERAERIRSQERAEVAAHLHDSVLQTLALIQKNPGDSRRVSTLARSQERELRQWLAGGSPAGPGRTLAPALENAAAEVETLHQTPIEVVTVGDRPLDERSAAVLAAGREALTNAARHAGDGGPISLYAEITPERTQVFIRDRGPGFDPGAVPPGRHGLRDSIIGRMERHGGRAGIRSEPGEGTEIELTMEGS